jgi:hypothetical protein
MGASSFLGPVSNISAFCELWNMSTDFSSFKKEIRSVVVFLTISAFALAYVFTYEVPGAVSTIGLLSMAIGVSSCIVGLVLVGVICVQRIRKRRNHCIDDSH